MYFHSLNDYLKSNYGTKIYKLALKSGANCPNRDGKIGTGGCIFCSQKGSGDFAEPMTESVAEQIERAKLKVKNKAGEKAKFIAYFQDYSATYAPIEHLRRIFHEAIYHPDIAILSVATRPDCLPDDVLQLLDELNQIKPVWVELGFQTSHEPTAKYIRRGYDNACFCEAVENLRNLKIYTVAHLIIGLPFETDEIIYKSAEFIANQNLGGVKFHLLHVLKNTDLAIDYEKGLFKDLSLEKYCELLSGCIKRMPETTVIHRITGDGNKQELIAPVWSADKKKVLNTINKYFRDINLMQGELYVEKSH